jgi:hypothetical protein
VELPQNIEPVVCVDTSREKVAHEVGLGASGNAATETHSFERALIAR